MIGICHNLLKVSPVLKVREKNDITPQFAAGGALVTNEEVTLGKGLKFFFPFFSRKQHEKDLDRWSYVADAFTGNVMRVKSFRLDSGLNVKHMMSSCRTSKEENKFDWVVPYF